MVNSYDKEVYENCKIKEIEQDGFSSNFKIITENGDKYSIVPYFDCDLERDLKIQKAKDMIKILKRQRLELKLGIDNDRYILTIIAKYKNGKEDEYYESLYGEDFENFIIRVGGYYNI